MSHNSSDRNCRLKMYPSFSKDMTIGVRFFYCKAGHGPLHGSMLSSGSFLVKWDTVHFRGMYVNWVCSVCVFHQFYD